MSTYDENFPAGPSVRLSNFGFSVVGNEENGDELAEAARADMKAMGGVIAQLVFTALASEARLCTAPCARLQTACCTGRLWRRHASPV